MAESDSIVERVDRVRSSLEPYGDPRTVQAAVDGHCPDCDTRFVVDVRSDIGTITCPNCNTDFGVQAGDDRQS